MFPALPPGIVEEDEVFQEAERRLRLGRRPVLPLLQVILLLQIVLERLEVILREILIPGPRHRVGEHGFSLRAGGGHELADPLQRGIFPAEVFRGNNLPIDLYGLAGGLRILPGEAVKEQGSRAGAAFGDVEGIEAAQVDEGCLGSDAEVGRRFRRSSRLLCKGGGGGQDRAQHDGDCKK